VAFPLGTPFLLALFGIHAMGGPAIAPKVSKLAFASCNAANGCAHSGHAGMEQLSARKLQEDQDRDRVISSLWARFEELNEKVQALQQHLQQQPQQQQHLQQQQPQQDQQEILSVATPRRPAPVQGAVDAPPQGYVASIAEQVGLEVSRFDIRVQALLDEMNERNARLKNTQTFLDSAVKASIRAAASDSADGWPGIEDSLDAPHAAATNVVVLLQKLERQVEEFDYLKSLLANVLVSVPVNTICASRIALYSAGLTTDERREALSALDKKELEYKTFLRNVQLVRPASCQATPA